MCLSARKIPTTLTILLVSELQERKLSNGAATLKTVGTSMAQRDSGDSGKWPLWATFFFVVGFCSLAWTGFFLLIF